MLSDGSIMVDSGCLIIMVIVLDGGREFMVNNG